MTTGPKDQERRQAPRVDLRVAIQVAVEVRDVGRPGVRYTFTRDLSELGMFLLDEAASVGDELELVFDLPDVQRNVLAYAVVRRVVRRGENDPQEPGIGVELTRDSEASMNAIQRYITKNLKPD